MIEREACRSRLMDRKWRRKQLKLLETGSEWRPLSRFTEGRAL
jgi:hypothetical protein